MPALPALPERGAGAGRDIARGDERYDGRQVGLVEGERLKVCAQPDGRIAVPTNRVLKPAGTQVPLPGRLVDIALCDNGRSLAAKNMAEKANSLSAPG
jgi:hypothetical protein